MGKEITLPWTCEAQEKAFHTIKYIALIGFPILLSVGVYRLYVNDYYAGYYLITGFLGTFMTWMMAWILGYIEFPSFVCKCDEQPKEMSG